MKAVDKPCFNCSICLIFSISHLFIKNTRENVFFSNHSGGIIIFECLIIKAVDKPCFNCSICLIFSISHLFIKNTRENVFFSNHSGGIIIFECLIIVSYLPTVIFTSYSNKHKYTSTESNSFSPF